MPSGLQNNFRVLFLVDAGPRSGLGHISRSLALAQALKERGSDIRFLLRPDPFSTHRIRAQGFPVHTIENSSTVLDMGLKYRVDWLVVDSYMITARYLRIFFRNFPRVAVIDDIGDRKLTADVVVNSSPAAGRIPYRMSAGCIRLFGSTYSLSPAKPPPKLFRRPPKDIRRILVTFGAAYPQQMYTRILPVVTRVFPLARIDAIQGPYMTAKRTGRDTFKFSRSIEFHQSPENLDHFFKRTDLVIAGGGQTLYEILGRGLPMAGICLAENQRPNLMGFSKKGALIYAADAEDQNMAKKLERALHRLKSREIRSRVGMRGRKMVDGQGAARVAECLLNISRIDRPMKTIFT